MEDSKDDKNKILMIKLDNYTMDKALAEYLSARNANPIAFGGVPAYFKAIIDMHIKDEKLREGLMNDLRMYIGDHFWAGAFLAKNKPEMVKLSYENMKQLPKKEEFTAYMG